MLPTQEAECIKQTIKQIKYKVTISNWEDIQSFASHLLKTSSFTKLSTEEKLKILYSSPMRLRFL